MGFISEEETMTVLACKGGHLVERVFDNDKDGRVSSVEPPVEGSEAGAVMRSAVGQLPRVAHCPGRQLC